MAVFKRRPSISSHALGLSSINSPLSPNITLNKQKKRNFVLTKWIIALVIAAGLFLNRFIVTLYRPKPTTMELIQQEKKRQEEENYLHRQHHHQKKKAEAKIIIEEETPPKSSSQQQGQLPQQQKQPQCRLRQYPPHRYYRADLPVSEQPDFLKGPDVQYIRGKWPAVLPIRTQHQHQPIRKLCVDQTEWLGGRGQKNPVDAFWNKNDQSELPFADGTNPSIIAIERLKASSSSSSPYQEILDAYPHAKYLATACMTNSQCQWKDTPAQQREFHLSTSAKPATVRTILFVLTDQFESLAQTTIYLELDADWGRRVKKQPKQQNNNGDSSPDYQNSIQALDDARLFVHNEQLWISYREGKGFGYDAQVLNIVHLSMVTTATSTSSTAATTNLSAVMKASETTTFCCGRNMALMENLVANVDNNNNNNNEPSLQSLTWVDPVTVIQVDTTPTRLKKNNKRAQQRRRRLLEEIEDNIGNNNNNNGNNNRIHNSTTISTVAAAPPVTTTRVSLHGRRLGSERKNEKKSHVHGTNAFMVHLPATNEFLGIGHFHRPSDRKSNPYARFGHHYTHAFFTIADQPPHRLSRLSAEWILPAAADTMNKHKVGANNHAAPVADGEIIQFASGLEVVDQDVIVAYGINDCEAAIVSLDMQTLDSLLESVDEGKEVVDYMRPLIIKPS